ncbi:hypothetical protein FN846DRAFT_954537 [Sphaerosporella brunnea]|uniref:Secreted protein n=1 Tax=Sphaerosporella brunnea TaxID=1250544 RepID=A0A5J5EV19_9PEZI|nr:hypothetical protein FN846DRAFT_954537 [Sphaerosporella brunnea]
MRALSAPPILCDIFFLLLPKQAAGGQRFDAREQLRLASSSSLRIRSGCFPGGDGSVAAGLAFLDSRPPVKTWGMYVAGRGSCGITYVAQLWSGTITVTNTTTTTAFEGGHSVRSDAASQPQQTAHWLGGSWVC